MMKVGRQIGQMSGVMMQNITVFAKRSCAKYILRSFFLCLLAQSLIAIKLLNGL